MASRTTKRIRQTCIVGAGLLALVSIGHAENWVDTGHDIQIDVDSIHRGPDGLVHYFHKMQSYDMDDDGNPAGTSWGKAWETSVDCSPAAIAAQRHTMGGVLQDFVCSRVKPIAAQTAPAPSPTSAPLKRDGSLSKEVMAALAKSPEYARLDTVYEQKRRETPGWEKTLEARAMFYVRNDMRDCALSAGIDVGADGRKQVGFTQGGNATYLGSLVPSQVAVPGSEASRDAAAIISRFIVEGAVGDTTYKAVESQFFPVEPLVDLDDRPAALHPRARDLLVVEARKAHDDFAGHEAPKLLLRLAQVNVELEAASIRDRASVGRTIVFAMRAMISDSESALRAQEAETLLDSHVELVKIDDTLEDAGHTAVESYEQLEAQYPNSGSMDDVAFGLARELERAGDTKNAVEKYRQLIANWPQSKWIAKAHLALGEIFLADAASDPSQSDIAELQFTKAATIPPARNPGFGYAHYRLASIARSNGDSKMAIAELKIAIDFAAKYPAAPHAKALASAARSDLARLTAKP